MKHTALDIVNEVLSEDLSDMPDNVQNMTISEVLERAMNKDPEKYEEMKELLSSVISELAY